MRLSWILDANMSTSIGDIQQACSVFYKKYEVIPDTVKLTHQDYSRFIGQMYQQAVQTLESGKKYGLFVAIPGGLVELLLLDSHDEAVVNSTASNVGNDNNTIIVVESSQVDIEFEKHVLNKENK